MECMIHLLELSNLLALESSSVAKLDFSQAYWGHVTS